ncbi:MAG: EAL domain-containing protein [Betaproteobacteria bacterium]|nr:EAL domain-containing protein [Betaproteobacteria bacterium]
MTATGKSACSVMVLDDEPFMLQLLCQMLNNLGFDRVTACDNGRVALDCIDDPNGAPDLILCDLNMPRMDGIEFLRYLVEHRYAGGVILVSGEDERTLLSAETLARTHRINVLGRLGKPPSSTQLAGLMARWQHQGQSHPGQTHPGQTHPGQTHPGQTLPPAAKISYDAHQLRAAIANSEFVNYYQPKVAVGTGMVVGVETLVRWRHPTDGVVLPDRFIGVAEAHGLIGQITRTVLVNAFAQLRAWREAGLVLRLAVNVSMDDLASLDFPDYVAAQAAAADVSPNQVVLELTESRLMFDLRMPLEILTRLRLKRFSLSIDDFGTGHSSLAQLRDLPFDEIKLDRTFVHGAVANSTMHAIYEVSLDLANQLGMNFVAEGVEDQADWDFLRRTGCAQAQGYFIAKPMPAAALPGWVADWEERVRGGLGA